MKAFRWSTAGLAALVLLSGSTAFAQSASRTMFVVIKFNPDQRAWDLAPRIARATAMPFVGVSPSTNSAVYTVRTELDAGRNQQLVLEQFPNTVFSYNYGLNYPRPADLEATQPQAGGGANDPRRNLGFNRRPARAAQPVMLTPQSRQAARDWFGQAQRAGAQLRVGQVLDSAARVQGAPPTFDLLRLLPTIPNTHRYLLVGNSLVLVDAGYTVVDFLNLAQ